jgi:hypothetical protein
MPDGCRDAQASLVRLLSLAVALGGMLNACSGHLGGSEDGTPGTGGAAGTDGAGSAPGEGGTVGSGGTVGTVGVVDAAGAFGDPACLPKVAQGTACTPVDQQFCYKPCGPEGAGVRSETCRSGSGLYTEMDGCSYDPTRDYSCYRIPVEPDSACAAAPRAGAACDLPACRACNSAGGMARGEYFSAAGAPTTGWCVCPAPDAAGKRTWSCANAPTWPCPLGSGC